MIHSNDNNVFFSTINSKASQPTNHFIPTRLPAYLLQVVDLLDVLCLEGLQLMDVPHLVTALLEEGGWPYLEPAHGWEQKIMPEYSLTVKETMKT